MNVSEDFYIDVGRVLIAHEYVLNGSNNCDYSSGRRIYGISLALNGEAEYRFISGNRFKVKQGDLVFLPANTAYTILTNCNYRHYTVNFQIHNEYSANMLECEEMLILHTVNVKRFKTLFGEAAEIWKEKKCGYEMRAVKYVYELLAAFVEEYNDLRVAKDPNYRRILPAKEYIEENYAQPITLSFLSALCGMSETNFRRRFLEIFGETPISYRDKLRILHAKDFLSGGYCSVTETAEKCGFSDVSYFCRFFKKHTELTPREFSQL